MRLPLPFRPLGRAWPGSARAGAGWIAAAALIAVVSGPGCESARRSPQVLLIGVDGADWSILSPMIAAGELPNFAALAQEGVHAPLWTLQPIISPVIWTTIATGKGPDAHGILDFTMPDPSSGAPMVISSSMRRTKAFWNILSDAGLRVGVIGWWASWPAEPVDGIIVTDRIRHHAFLASPHTERGKVHPEERLDEILALQGRARDVPYETARQFLNVSEAEYAAAPPLDFKDPISHFRHIHQTMADYAEIAEHVLRTIRPEVLAVYFEGIDTAGHMYMRYAPPEYPGTTESDRARYGATVEAFYRYQDEILGRLLAYAGEDTYVLVVSDHGFHTGHRRPVEPVEDVDYATAAAWHKMDGVLLVRGPGIAPSGPGLPGGGRATVFDITPTLLAMAGVPPARDMDGRVLSELFDGGFSAPEEVASYDDAAWQTAREHAAASLEGLDPETRDRLRSLGYIGAHESDAMLSLRGQWGLAEYYIYRDRLEDAARELEDLAARAPDWAEAQYHLGLVRMRQGELDEAEQLYRRALELDPDKMEVRMNLAGLYRRAGNLPAARTVLEEGLELAPWHVEARVNLGMLCREMGDPGAAWGHLAEAVRLAPDSHPAQAQAALALEVLDRRDQAAQHWRKALRLRPDDRIARTRLEAISGTAASP